MPKRMIALSVMPDGFEVDGPEAESRGVAAVAASSGDDSGRWVMGARRRGRVKRPGEDVVAALLFGGASFAAAAIGSVATSAGQEWYDSLEKPAFTPPDAAFGIVWTVLYILVAVAGWLVWRRTDDRRPTVAWAVQMGLNLVWTCVFFGLEAPWPGVVVIVALVAAIVVTIVLARRVSAVSAALLVPYLLWVCFATALNVGVAVLN